ncbi:UvrD-helicase domain-containing protein [Hymenobacter sp. YC55]|uniref:UvrD-helicase domain-containing protein n=1 Tax=Hymenobacter sp. YC55 TaxID=3034019 RepID=UPI0023F79B77|nr:UvrD-helicase domain-containing protein [Hymenobacter sp. YC55]MDF7815331.1 UvrD-helicase domain-containing protein [Hymenobacter sp. YC55]
MKLTPEQKAIVATRGNLKINAVAGSGKTSTLLAYAKAQPPKAKGLYLAFNKTVKIEARERFAEAGLPQVQVETAHSLAYGRIIRGSRYRVRATAYRPYELAQLLDLEQLPEAQALGTGHGARTFSFILAAHIVKVLAAFCNSAVPKVKDLRYTASVQEPKAHAFAQQHEALIERLSRHVLNLLDTAQIEVTHDFYLKKFQLEGQQLNYDYILFDEAQDASGSMLDWFLKQTGATKVMVGDTHQQIYAWRGAVNSLEKVNYPTLPLSTSFRFGPDIAQLASAILGFKAPGGRPSPAQRVQLIGAGKSTAELTRAIIGRSNLGLLVKAISYITGPHAVERIYFEGNLRAYIYGAEGASLYDVLNIYKGDRGRVRDPMLVTMANLAEVEEYATQTGDQELLLLIELVETYGDSLLSVMAELKRRQVEDSERHTAQVFFSTVHRCKGLEYDLVELAPDFITTEDVINWHLREFSPQRPTPAEQVLFQEQVNLLYVGLTRSRYRLWLPQDSLPLQYRLPVPAEGQTAALVGYPGKGTTYLTSPGVVEAGVVRGKRKTAAKPAPAETQPPRTGLPWSVDDERRLTIGFCQDERLPALAAKLQRSEADVAERIKVLDLAERYGL